MGGSGQSTLIEKSYKLLFIIYAPIAILSILYKSFGGVDHSYLYIFSLAVSVFSLLMGIVIVVVYFLKRKIIISKPDWNTQVPFFIKHDFLIPYIIISVIFFSIASYLIYKKYGHFETSPNSTIINPNAPNQKVALLIPLSQNIATRNMFKLEQGERMLIGLTALYEAQPELADKYEFIIVNHRQNYDQKLAKKVAKLVSEGCKYIISTTSRVSVPLANNFEQMLDTVKYGKNRPVLICTSTSSSKLPTQPGLIYRFYVREIEEVELLVKKANALGVTNMTFIAPNEQYGKDAIELYSRIWQASGKNMSEGLFFDPVLSTKRIAEKVQDNIETFKKAEAIFIPAYHANLIGCLRGLKGLENKIILSGFGLTSAIVQQAAKDVLAKHRWFAVVPEYNALVDEMSTDTQATFLFLTLLKTLKVIEETNNNVAEFDKFWVNSIYPEYVSFENVVDGDIKIKVKLTNKLTSLQFYPVD